MAQSGRGKPKAGYRNTKALAERLARVNMPDPTPSDETDAQIEERINARFATLDSVIDDVLEADDGYAVILTGPAGIGKSFTVEKKLREWDPDRENHRITKGYLRPTGLYKLLWDYRHPGNVLVFDDADHIFFDEIALNLLKAVCDTSARRVVTWGTEAVLVSEKDADVIPHNFEYEGNIIFITNHDLDEMSNKSKKLADHYRALIDRAQYLDLAMWGTRERMVRLKQVVREGGMLDHLTIEKRDEVIRYIEDNHERLRDVSLRTAVKLAKLCAKPNWKEVASVTMCRDPRKSMPKVPEALVKKLPPEVAAKVVPIKAKE